MYNSSSWEDLCGVGTARVNGQRLIPYESEEELSQASERSIHRSISERRLSCPSGMITATYVEVDPVTGGPLVRHAHVPQEPWQRALREHHALREQPKKMNLREDGNLLAYWHKLGGQPVTQPDMKMVELEVLWFRGDDRRALAPKRVPGKIDLREGQVKRVKDKLLQTGKSLTNLHKSVQTGDSLLNLLELKDKSLQTGQSLLKLPQLKDKSLNTGKSLLKLLELKDKCLETGRSLLNLPQLKNKSFNTGKSLMSLPLGTHMSVQSGDSLLNLVHTSTSMDLQEAREVDELRQLLVEYGVTTPKLIRALELLAEEDDEVFCTSTQVSSSSSSTSNTTELQQKPPEMPYERFRFPKFDKLSTIYEVDEEPSLSSFKETSVPSEENEELTPIPSQEDQTLAVPSPLPAVKSLPLTPNKLDESPDGLRAAMTPGQVHFERLIQAAELDLHEPEEPPLRPRSKSADAKMVNTVDQQHRLIFTRRTKRRCFYMDFFISRVFRGYLHTML